MLDSFFEAAYGKERYQRVKNALQRPSSISTLRVNLNHLETSSTTTTSTTSSTSLPPSPLTVLVQEMAPLNDRLLQQNRPLYTVKTHAHVENCLVIPSAPPPPNTNNNALCTVGAVGIVGDMVVDRRAGEAILCGSDIFAKGVLACTRPIPPVGSKIRVHSVEKTRAARGGTPEEFIKASMDHNEGVTAIGVGVIRLNRHQIFHQEEGVAVEMWSRYGIGDAPPMNELVKRLNSRALLFSFFAQTVPSMVASLALGIEEGNLILDCCASPGGKTTHLAGLLNGKGTVVAIDKTPSKVRKVKQLAASMGYSSVVQAVCANTTTIVDKAGKTLNEFLEEVRSLEGGDASAVVRIGSSKKTSGKKRRRKDEISTQSTQSTQSAHRTIIPSTTCGLKPQSFDRVLLDAPCSAIGQRPRLVTTSKTLKDLTQCADYQMVLMKSAVELLKVGGFLVYSTCSHSLLEDEMVVAKTLREYPNMELVALPENLAKMGSNGLPAIQIQKAMQVLETANDGTSQSIQRLLSWEDRGLSDAHNQLVRRFDPDGPDDTIGFFVAKFVKRS